MKIAILFAVLLQVSGFTRARADETLDPSPDRLSSQGVRPFSAQTNYMSPSGYARYLRYRQTGQWMSLPQPPASPGPPEPGTHPMGAMRFDGYYSKLGLNIRFLRDGRALQYVADAEDTPAIIWRDKLVAGAKGDVATAPYHVQGGELTVDFPAIARFFRVTYRGRAAPAGLEVNIHQWAKDSAPFTTTMEFVPMK